jgi:hypothetical protein
MNESAFSQTPLAFSVLLQDGGKHGGLYENNE